MKIGFRTYIKTILIQLINILNISSKYIGSPKDVITVKDWIKIRYSTYSPPYYYFKSEQWINQKLPQSLNNTISWRFKRYKKTLDNEQFIIKILNGRVYGPKGAIITDDDYLLSDVSREFRHYKSSIISQYSIFKKLFLGRLKHIRGNVAVITSDGYDNYFHLLLDILPRLELFKKSNLINEIDYFIFPPKKYIEKLGLNNELEYILKSLNISKNKLIFSDNKNFHIEADNLFVPSLPSYLGQTSKMSIDFIRNNFLDKNSKKNDYNYIYITRKHAKNRKIKNEDELLEILKLYGFKNLICEHKTIFEKAAIFNNAKCVISMHGAGLTNLVFCQKECIVLNLFSSSYVDPNFWILSNNLKLNYYYLISDSQKINEHNDYFLDKKDGDSIINLEKIKIFLANHLKLK